MDFLVAKELEGDSLQEICSCSDLNRAVLDAIDASQRIENSGSVIVVLHKSGARARMKADNLSDLNRSFFQTAVTNKLEKEISRAL